MIGLKKKVALIDFDGVVLRNKKADTCVAKRAGIYTWKAVSNVPRSMSQIGIRQANDLCYNLYKGYGHTLLGLNAMGVTSNLEDYNKMVYNTIDYKKLREENNDFTDLRRFLDYCKQENIDTYAFSNAPNTWLQNTLLDDSDILACMPDVRTVLKVNANDATYLKPQPAVFSAINSGFYDYDKIVFIDDNISNMRHTLHNNKWKNLLFGSSSKKINNNLFLVSGFDDVIDVI
jgi:FMN phosphatase YigB (HAD superfamily)